MGRIKAKNKIIGAVREVFLDFLDKKRAYCDTIVSGVGVILTL